MEQVTIDKVSLEKLRIAMQAISNEFAPIKWKEKPVPFIEMYRCLRKVGIAIEAMSVGAGIVQCGFPECKNVATFSTTLGIHFCAACYNRMDSVEPSSN